MYCQHSKDVEKREAREIMPAVKPIASMIRLLSPKLLKCGCYRLHRATRQTSSDWMTRLFTHVTILSRLRLESLMSRWVPVGSLHHWTHSWVACSLSISRVFANELYLLILRSIIVL